jgi:DNA-binding HxlR family transcriptional regulator
MDGSAMDGSTNVPDCESVPDCEAAMMQELVADVFAAACPSRQTLDNVTGRWGTLAMVALTEGAYRFNALRRRVQGVSEKMLSQTLQALERDGLVHRDVQATIPPRVEYSLTPLGERVGAKLRELIDLVEEEMPAVRAARERYDGQKQATAAAR